MVKKFKILQKLKRKLTLLTSIFIVILSIFFVKKSNKYEITSPFFDTVIQGVYATGYIKTQNYADITPNIIGRVENILVNEGENIVKGQLLIKLEDSVEKETLEELRTSVEYLKNEEKRQKDLLKKGYVSASEYEQIAREYSVTKAQLRRQERLLERMEIKSPIDGTVLKIETEIGEMLEKSSGGEKGEVAVSVGDLSDMIVEVDVDEEDIPLIKVGQKTLITLDAFPDKILDGIVKKISLKGDSSDKSFRVVIDIDENLNTMVGMTSDVNIVIKTKENALLIPRKSLIKGNKVYVKTFNKIVEKDVKIGLKDEHNVEILEGLSEDDKILLRPNLYLKNVNK